MAEVEDEEAMGIGLGLDPDWAAWRAFSNWLFAVRRSLRVWGWGRVGASDPEERRRVLFLAWVSGSVGKGFKEDWGLSAGGGGGAELAYTVTWGAVRVAQTRPPAWEPAEA